MADAQDKEAEIARLKRELANGPAKKPRRLGCLAYAGIGFLALIALGVIGSMMKHPDSTASSPPAESQASAPAASSGNAVHDKLLSRTPQERALILGIGAGHQCRGVEAFFDGMGHGKVDRPGTAYWSVRCADGQSFLVSLAPNDKGNKVLACSVLKAIHASECFTKF